ncbi:MAG: DUF4147 domain-containing protein [Planctomycetota bacterium]
MVDASGGEGQHGLLSRVASAVLAACDPCASLCAALEPRLDDPSLAGPLVLIAIGKGAGPMATEASRLLGERIARGVVLCPRDHVDRTAEAIADSVEVLGCDHPLPTASNLEAARHVAGLAASLGAGDRVLALLSGGVSAYLASPIPPIKLDDLRALTDALLRSGATIDELNAVRKHCESLKGGGLAKLLAPAWCSAYVLSDVLGDPIGTIGSGPLAADPTTFAEALDVLERRGARSEPARTHLERGARGEIEETLKPGDPADVVEHHIIANNDTAVDAAAAALRQEGLEVAEVRRRVRGEAAVVGRELAEQGGSLAPRSALVLGGETTVWVGSASGKGGRNQELSLAAALEIEGIDGIGVLSLATDGVDGPTDAAGAVVDAHTAALIRSKGIAPEDALARHDSHTALDAAGALIRTGPSGTNLNDVMVAVRF